MANEGELRACTQTRAQELISRIGAHTEKAREALKESNTEVAEGELAEMRRLREELDSFQLSFSKRDEGQRGDDERDEVLDREKFNRRQTERGKFEYSDVPTMTSLPSDARVVYTAGHLELTKMIPEEVRSHPLAKWVHLPTDREDIKALQVAHDNWILSKQRRANASTMSLLTAQYREMVTKAAIMEGATSGVGSEWVPTYFSAEMSSDIFATSQVLSLFRQVPCPRPSTTYQALTGRGTVYRAPGASDSDDWQVPNVTPSTLGTANRTFTADKLMAIVGRSDELDEDSIVPVQDVTRTQVIELLRNAMEDAVINGSTSTTDLDNAGTALWTDSADPRHSWDGIRKDCIVTTTTTVSGATFNTAALTGAISALGFYGFGGQQANCAWIAGPDAFAKFLALTEANTLYAFGPKATVLTGQLGEVYGIPLFQSYNVYGPNQGTGLNASGVYDGSTTTKTTALLVNRDKFWIGTRREIRVEEERSGLAGMSYFIVTWRGDFQKMVTSTHTTSCALINIA